MEYPFNSDVKYLDKGQLKHFELFLEKEPIPKNIYVNAKGEERKCTRVDYPKGVIMKRTVSFLGDKNVTYYHTPCATVDGGKSRILYFENGEPKKCFSDDWLKWLGKEYDVVEHDSKTMSEAERQKTLATLKMMKRSETKEGQGNKKESNWKPLVKTEN